MSTHKSIDRVCIAITAVTLVIALLFCCGGALGIETTAHAIGYENRIFDKTRVHTIDIVMNDWDGFIESCESEEYTPCSVVIDGEAIKNVGIRAKGNTSLSSVKKSGTDRYSFKIEFDQYDSTKTYHGLDKLCLNNIIQDNTYMKDYLAYTLMYDFGVDSPLCSYAYITVNGDDWGLYLAVEAVEESFLKRNYGSSYGDLYKPDSISFGGGRGNGMDFSMSDFMNENSSDSDNSENDSIDNNKENSSTLGGFNMGNKPDLGLGMPEGLDMGNMPDFSSIMPEGFEKPDGLATSDSPNGKQSFGGFGGGMGSDDVKLKYIDDYPDSYSNIFGNAKTTVNTADEKRLIRSLRALSEQKDLESTVDIDEVLRYFVVHIFLCNGDSYTGQMIHNYYLYEEDGQLSMIPWDYNLAFGSFSGGNATSSVNSPIDTPISGDMSDRPMVAWIFDSEEYTQQYHELFSEFLGSVDISELVTETAALIDEYVEKDPTKFCTYEEFEKCVAAIKEFCTLRTESVLGQLDGSIPSTTDGQSSDSSSLVDASSLNTSDMGSMGNGGGFGGGDTGSFGKPERSSSATSGGTTDTEKPKTEISGGVVSDGSFESLSFSEPSAGVILTAESSERSDNGGGMPNFSGQAPGGFGGQMPEGSNGQMPGAFGGQMPDGFNGQMPGGFGGQMPDDFNGQMPGDFGGQMPDDFNGQMPNSSGSSDDKETETPDSPQNDRQQNVRPTPGDFSGMSSRPSGTNATTYIMLGVSVAVLLLGLAFALKFKR